MRLLSYKFLILLLCAALASCGGSGGGSGSTGSGGSGDWGDSGDTGPGGQPDEGGDSGGEDAAPGDGDESFVIVQRTPEPGAVNRALLGDITIHFSKPPLAQTVNGKAIRVLRGSQDIPATIEYTEGEAELSISFPGLLLPDSRYIVSINEQLMAADGGSFIPREWAFHTAGNIGATSQETLDSCMNDVHINMLAAVNNARAQARSCGGSSFPAVQPLIWHCGLAGAALAHSMDMARYGVLSHTGSDGLDAGQRLYNAGYNWRGYAENIAAGYLTVDGVMEGWLQSPGHCKNIMSPNVIEFGAARADTSGAQHADYWTQLFAFPSR